MVENVIHPEGAPRRFAPEMPFPVYAYVPGRHPQPSRTGFARTVDCGDQDKTHRYALDLFNYGYYWEAHEAWETLWHAYGRHSLEGRLIHGLIALAAAGVKAREGNALGVVHHVRRAAAIFRDLSAERLVPSKNLIRRGSSRRENRIMIVGDENIASIGVDMVGQSGQVTPTA